jgi:hypothetical protein
MAIAASAIPLRGLKKTSTAIRIELSKEKLSAAQSAAQNIWLMRRKRRANGTDGA